jgi:hypothetical protein
MGRVTYRFHSNVCMGLFSVIVTLPFLNPRSWRRKEASSVPYETRTWGLLGDQSAATHDIKLLELVSLHAPSAVPEADGEPLGVGLNLALPLHKSDNGGDNERRLAARLREKEGNGLNTGC